MWIGQNEGKVPISVAGSGTALPVGWSGHAGSILLATLAIFTGLCLFTYHPMDSALFSSHPQVPPNNIGGAVGTWIGLIGRAGFGRAAFFVPVWWLLWSWRSWRGYRAQIHTAVLTTAVVCLLASLATLLAQQSSTEGAATTLGGVSGFLLSRAGNYYIGVFGTLLTATCVMLLSWLVISSQTLGTSGFQWLRDIFMGLGEMLKRVKRSRQAASANPIAKVPTPALQKEKPRTIATSNQGPYPERQPVRGVAPKIRIQSTMESRPRVSLAPRATASPSGFRTPSLDTLTTPPPVSERRLTEDLQAKAKILEETLRDFGIAANVVNIDQGPAVTRYEVQPAAGTKLTKIISLSDELALVLKTASCHVVAPLPGKGLVGIDVPNTTTTMVYLKEMLTSREYQSNKSPLAIPIGKDVSGRAVVEDLRDFPHLLIAGSTGSGKTVFLNSLLVSILSRATPEEVRMLMVDPKMVEMAAFRNIPHLIAPVVTDTKKASAALYWAVHEMERRYKMLARIGARNIIGYNERVAAGTLPEGNSEGEEPLDGRMPYLLIVIDELADLMMASTQDVEGAITRLAQLSRAVGIHIILATQRPSVNVVTGVIKANFPARIAFQVASKVDSRTILDMNGADKLLGRGDLLFLKPGAAKPLRAQGAFVTDAEIERVTQFLRDQGKPSFDQTLLEQQRKPASFGGMQSENDELYETAKQLVLEAGQASTSLLQRRLRLGYGRAARILDQMEQEGFVGPPQGSRPREVLASRVETTERQAS